MITFAEVKTFAEKQAAEGKAVGVCGNATCCLVAEAVLDKYPNLHNVWVGWATKDSIQDTLVIRVSETVSPANLQAPAYEASIEDPDVAKLSALIRGFDMLGWTGEVPASVVLPLFEEQAQKDTGFNAYEDIPQDDEDDDLPFDAEDEDWGDEDWDDFGSDYYDDWEDDDEEPEE